jgi:hypothetical protein
MSGIATLASKEEGKLGMAIAVGEVIIVRLPCGIGCDGICVVVLGRLCRASHAAEKASVSGLGGRCAGYRWADRMCCHARLRRR